MRPAAALTAGAIPTIPPTTTTQPPPLAPSIVPPQELPASEGVRLVERPRPRSATARAG
jgi:hypothetical protein